MNFADWILFESLPILIALFLPLISNLPYPTTIFTLTYNLNIILRKLDSFVPRISLCWLFLNMFLFGMRACFIFRLVFSPCLPSGRRQVQTQQPFCEVVWCDLKVLLYSCSRSQELPFCVKRKKAYFVIWSPLTPWGSSKLVFKKLVGWMPSTIYCSSHSEWS